MKDFKLGNLALFSEDQIKRLFENLFESTHHFTAVEMSPDSVESLIEHLSTYGKSHYFNVIPLNIVKDGELNICVQTINGVMDVMHQDHVICDICSKIVIPQKDIPHPFVDSTWDSMINELNDRGNNLFIFTSPTDYMDSIISLDVKRLYNIYFHHKDNIRLLFLVRESYKLNLKDNFSQHIRLCTLEELIKKKTMIVPKIYISHKWGNSDQITEKVISVFKKNHIEYSIDTKDVSYGINIRKYENELANGDAVLAIVNDDYLKSPACMYELSKIFDNGEEETRLMVILDVTTKKFRETSTLLYYKDFWGRQYDVLLNKLKNRQPADAGLETRMLDDVSLIVRRLPDIWLYWSDIINDDTSKFMAENGDRDLANAVLKKFGREESVDADRQAQNRGTTIINNYQNGSNNKIYNIDNADNATFN
jgi:hypothetical protein